MKLFWKQFIGMNCLVMVIFLVFGSLILNSSFQMALNREKERGMEEIRMFHYAFLASLQSLPEDYGAVDSAVAQIAQSIQKSMENSRNIIRVYDHDSQMVYESSDYQTRLKPEDVKISSVVSQITGNQGAYYLESMFEVRSGSVRYYLEIDRDISMVYEDRQILYEKYQRVLILVFSISSVLALLFSLQITRPVWKLSRATRQFTEGNYASRVAPGGNDEVTVLMCDFNRMAEQLEVNIRRLEEEARKQEDFTAAFAHELKTPLTSIIGFSGMLRSMELSDEEQQVSADFICQQGKRLERLSRKMLELIQADRQEITMRELETEQILETVKQIFIPIFEREGIQFQYSVSAGTLYGDPDLMQSLLGNLLDNARKACDRGGKVQMEGEPDAGGYVFRISDNGIGMPPEEIGRITEAFYMIDKSRSRREGGAGIGMALCKKIIELHNASWKIRSESGKGTEVSVWFLGKEESP